MGLAIVSPRWAYAHAGDRAEPGRAGSDLLRMVAIFLIATQLRGLVAAVWVGYTLDARLGLHAAVTVITEALTVIFVFLTLSAIVLYAAMGKRRELGVAFDLACVASLPLVYVQLVVMGAVRGTDIEIPVWATYVFSAVTLGWWMVALVFAALSPRKRGRKIPAPPPGTALMARRAGFVVIAVAIGGALAQISWLAQNLDDIRPMEFGQPAPQLALARVKADGSRGEVLDLSSLKGRPVVIDFWATWCGPCQKAMPEINRFAKKHPEATVLSVNTDNAEYARQMLDDGGYTSLTLLEGDDETAQRFGVTTIPHIVFVDRDGLVQDVARGGGDVEARYTRMSK